MVHCSPATTSKPPAGRTAVLFVGQGTQSVGMTKEELNIPEVAEMYRVAEEVLGYDLKKIVLEGPEEMLTQTEHAQPALLIAGLAAHEKLKRDSPEVVARCSAMAGLSLGEYTALVAAGALTFRDAIKVVGVRAKAMQAAGTRNAGAMTTVKGLDDAALERYCAQAAAVTGKVVQVANYLFPKCRVIAGDPTAVKAAADEIERDGRDKPRRDKPTVIPQQVSGAFHTSLMADAQSELTPVLNEVDFKMPTTPVIANTTGVAYTSVAEIREQLIAQIVQPVLWEGSITGIIAGGVKELYDVGPRDTITSMVKRIEMGRLPDKADKAGRASCTSVKV